MATFLSLAICHLVGLRGSVWLERGRYEEAEGKYGQAVAHDRAGRTNGKASHLCHSIEATMSMIQQSLSAKTQTTRRVDLEQRVAVLERENSQLKTDVIEMKGRIAALESRLGTSVPTVKKVEEGFDLFCDEEGEEEAVKPEPVKSKKPPVVAKSTIVLEVKPWEAETDMKEVEKLVRGIACDGLLWKASKLVDVAYGIKKLQISCVVEDEKVSVDFLEESITAFEDYVQSVDIAAFNKL